MTEQVNESGEAKKRLIIDEDWKSQVEAERETLKHSPPAAGAADARDATQLPPPSLMMLAGSLAAQAMLTLGLAIDPATQKVEVDLVAAKHFIDTLEMLYSKTEGNRTPEETRDLDNLLHELRMAFVAISQQSAGGRLV